VFATAVSGITSPPADLTTLDLPGRGDLPQADLELAGAEPAPRMVLSFTRRWLRAQQPRHLFVFDTLLVAGPACSRSR
jgi:hypothetical protein